MKRTQNWRRRFENGAWACSAVRKRARSRENGELSRDWTDTDFTKRTSRRAGMVLLDTVDGNA